MKHFTSDWHLGDDQIVKLSNRPFKSAEEQDEYIFNMVMETTKPGDQIYFLGDLGKLSAITKFFEKLPRNRGFHWIEGNHDKNNSHRFRKSLGSISKIKEVKIGDNHTTLCHYPMLTWNKSHYNSWQLFGHHHICGHGSERLAERIAGKMLNVNLEFNNYRMYDENDIISIMNTKSDNWDYIPKNERER